MKISEKMQLQQYASRHRRFIYSVDTLTTVWTLDWLDSFFVYFCDYRMTALDITEVMHLSMSSPRGGCGQPTRIWLWRISPGWGFWPDVVHLICQFQSRWEVSHLFLLILTIIFCPGVGILIIVFRKCQNPHPMPPPPPPPLGLSIVRCITLLQRKNGNLLHYLKNLHSTVPPKYYILHEGLSISSCNCIL